MISQVSLKIYNNANGNAFQSCTQTYLSLHITCRAGIGTFILRIMHNVYTA